MSSQSSRSFLSRLRPAQEPETLTDEERLEKLSSKFRSLTLYEDDLQLFDSTSWTEALRESPRPQALVKQMAELGATESWISKIIAQNRELTSLGSIGEPELEQFVREGLEPEQLTTAAIRAERRRLAAIWVEQFCQVAERELPQAARAIRDPESELPGLAHSLGVALWLSSPSLYGVGEFRFPSAQTIAKMLSDPEWNWAPVRDSYRLWRQRRAEKLEGVPEPLRVFYDRDSLAIGHLCHFAGISEDQVASQIERVARWLEENESE